MAKRRSSSSSSSKSSRASPSISNNGGSNKSSVLEKIAMLRNFCPSFSENDLSSCLSQSGYNVELAAERLMTGQYKPTSTPKHNNNAKPTQKQSQNTANQKAAPMISSINTPSPSSAAAFTDTPPTTASSSSGSIQKKRPSPENPINTSQQSSAKKRSPAHVIPPTPRLTANTTASTANTNTDIKHDHNNHKNRQPVMLPPHALLLCERWLVGTCTTRQGRVAHREVLELSHYHTGNNTHVRFRASAIEGNLSRSLSAILNPILRYNTNDNDNAAANASEATQGSTLLHLRAEALMQDTNIPIGGEVPLNITVYISDPWAFFALFDEQKALHQSSSSSSSMYFANKNNQNKKGSYNSNKLNSKMSLSEAAFALLQWAEYGHLPEIPHFLAPLTNSDSTTTSDADTESKTTGNKLEYESKDSDNDDDCDILLQEEDFTADEGSGEEKEGDGQPEWAKSVNSGESDKNKLSLPELDDPRGFRQSVVLRPYQRQALYWMMKREQEGESREELEKELTLLSELASNHRSNGNQSSGAPPLSTWQTGSAAGGPSNDIRCDCSPVLVSESARKTATTLDGETNPVNHPLWKTRYLANITMDTAYLFYVNELLGIASSEPPAPPQQCNGGILADDMGLGKTVMLLALCLKYKEMKEDEKDYDDKADRKTLVVCPLSLLGQWEEEIETKTSLSFRVCYGNQSKKCLREEFDEEIIITTYGTMQSELQMQQKGSGQSYGILRQDWLRVILDEGHCIKNQSTLAAKACCLLKATYRWVVTGTIIHNSLDDVFSLVKFLRHQPWCVSGFWKAAISEEVKRNDESESEDDGPTDPSGMMVAVDRVRRLLGPIMLRRTKDSVSSDGSPILVLPPIEEKIVNVTLTNAEREFYNALLSKSQSIFEGYLKAGTANKSWLQIFSLLHRLRAMCDHIALTVKSHIDEADWTIAKTGAGLSPIKEAPPSNEAVDDDFLNGLLQKFRVETKADKKTDQNSNNDDTYSDKVAHGLSQAIRSNATRIDEECPICLEQPLISEACMTSCAHTFCKECLLDVLKKNTPAKNRQSNDASEFPVGNCPVCQSKVESANIILLSKENGGYTSTFLKDKKQLSTIQPLLKGNAVAIAARGVLEQAIRGAESSKLAAVIKELHLVWESDPGSKVLVFSQFLGCLDLIEARLQKEEIPFGRLDGSMTLKQRMASLELFKSNNSSVPSGPGPLTKNQRIGSVMLVSMRAAGVGLNLVAASTVMIVDPWWNQSIEDQCINRVHRIGQTAEMVRVRKFVVSDSVEEKIVELQKKKKGMANEVYSTGGEVFSTRPTLEDFKLIFGNM